MRAQLIGERAVLKQKDIEAVVAGKSHADAIRSLLQLSAVRPLEALDTASVRYHAQKLHEAWEAHAALMEKIMLLDEEIG